MGWLALAAAVAAAVAAPPAQSQLVGTTLAMADNVNRIRQAHGLPVLRATPELTWSASGYARSMLDQDRFGHLTSIRAPAHFGRLGETLAWHAGWRPRVDSTVSGWMRSPTHRAVLLNPSYRVIGAALWYGHYGRGRATAWVAHLGG